MHQYKVLVADELSNAGLQILQDSPQLTVEVNLNLSEDKLCAIIADFDAVVVRSKSKITAQVIAKGIKLKLIARAGIGVDNIDVKAAQSKNIAVMNAPEANAVSAAEHAISLMLSLCRHIPQAHASMTMGKWEKNKFLGTEITAKTLGLIGLGNIGRIVAQKAQGLGMKVIASDFALLPEQARQLDIQLFPLEELYAQADIISIHTTLNAHSKKMINAQAFSLMKNGVRIINAARGGIICEQSLLEALNQGKVAGVALDVFEQEPPSADYALLKHPLLIATPHLGASTIEAQERVAIQIAQQCRDFLLLGIRHNVLTQQES